jgi:hypothetical protein
MTIKQRQCLLCYMDCLEPAGIDGLCGPETAKATEAMQRKLSIEPDGIWGDQTDSAIREYIYSGADLPEPDAADTNVGNKPETGTFWDHIRYWTREEFKCQCGNYHAPYCDGYPAEPDQTLVELLDDIRAHFGRVAHRSSGLRCPQHNRDSKGVSNSKHLYGKAMDFFIEGVSGEAVRAYADADPRCNYTYVIEGQYVHVDVN